MKPLSTTEYSPEVRAHLLRPAQTFDPRDAHVVPDVEGMWCLVEIASREVEAELSKRRFGVYVPELRETTVSRGRKVDRRNAMFPGYAFVFFWNAGGNGWRLLSINGVINVVGSLHDEQVHFIRAIENAQGFPIASKKPRRHSKHASSRKWEVWLTELRSLDSDKRNQALRKLLGLF